MDPPPDTPAPVSPVNSDRKLKVPQVNGTTVFPVLGRRISHLYIQHSCVTAGKLPNKNSNSSYRLCHRMSWKFAAQELRQSYAHRPSAPTQTIRPHTDHQTAHRQTVTDRERQVAVPSAAPALREQSQYGRRLSIYTAPLSNTDQAYGGHRSTSEGGGNYVW